MNNNELFNSVIKGKKEVKIDDKTFELDINVEESLSILQFYTSMYKAANQENSVSPKIIKQTKDILKSVFGRNYVGLDEKILDDFVESRFIDIISSIAVACGWIKETLN